MTKNFFPYRKIILVFTIFAMSVSCKEFSSNHENASTQNVGAASQEVLITETVIPTNTLLVTSTATQTLIPTPDLKDVNTIIPLLFTKCKLPCWGGIIPGSTNETSAKRFLSSFGRVATKSVSFQYKNEPIVIDLTYKDDKVSSIHLPSRITESLKIRNLLFEYGIPEDIRIEIIPETAEGMSWFTLLLVYPQQGFFAVFSGEGVNLNSIINFCPDEISPDLYLFQTNVYSLSELNEIVFRLLQQRLKPLNLLTDFDIQNFYRIFLESSNYCVPTNVTFP